MSTVHPWAGTMNMASNIQPTVTFPPNTLDSITSASSLIGLGYNSLLNDFALNRAASIAVAVVPQNQFRVTIREVTDLESIRSSLSESIALSGSYGAVSAAASYSNDLETVINSYNLLFEVYVYCLLYRTYVVHTEATKTAKSIVDRNRFFQVYGDSCIGEIGLGGYALGFVRYSTYSNEQKEKVRRSLQGAAGSFGGAKLEASYEQRYALQVLKQHHSRSFAFEGQGIAAAYVPTSLEELQTYLPNIPKNIVLKPVYHKPVPYSGVDDLQSPDVSRACRNLAEWIKRRDTLRGRRNDLRIFQANPELFAHAEKYNAEELLNDTRVELSAAEGRITTIRNNPFTRSQPPNESQLPALPGVMHVDLEIEIVTSAGEKWAGGEEDQWLGSHINGIATLSIRCLRKDFSIEYSAHYKKEEPDGIYHSRRDGQLLGPEEIDSICDLAISSTGPRKWRLRYQCLGGDPRLDEFDNEENPTGRASFRSLHWIPVCRLRVWFEPDIRAIS